MNITIDYPMPYPLVELNKPDETIWKQKRTFEAKKFYAVSAPSGKGKSTFLHILYGKRKDFSGAVLWDENDVKAIKPVEWAKLRSNQISMVFQDLRLFQNMTGYENISIKNQLTGHLSDSQINTYANELGVSHIMQKKCKFMSFGERQRVAIIRALAQPFEWILLDEPFSHLDEQNAQIAAGMIQEACDKNNASLMIATLGQDKFFNYDEILNV